MAPGKIAKAAAVYPFALRRAILEGFRDQLTRDGYFKKDEVGVHVQWLEAEDDVRIYLEDAEAKALERGDVYKDALTGQPLVR